MEKCFSVFVSESIDDVIIVGCEQGKREEKKKSAVAGCFVLDDGSVPAESPRFTEDSQSRSSRLSDR